MFFQFFVGDHKFRVELHGYLRPGTSLISTERVTFGNKNVGTSLRVDIPLMSKQTGVQFCTLIC